MSISRLQETDCSSVLLLAQLSFLESFLQQVTPYSVKKLLASTTLASGVLFGESGFNIVFGCEAIIEALDFASA